jgi:chromosome segregation ATPase
VKKQILISQDLSRKLNESEAANSHLQSQLRNFKIELQQSASVNNDLKKQLEAKEEILRKNNEEKKQMDIILDVLTETMDLVTQEEKQMLNTIDVLRETVDSFYQVVEGLCGQIKDVSTCRIQSVTLPSLKYLRVSGRSNSAQTQTFRLNVLLPSSWSHMENRVMSLVYKFTVLLEF